MEELSEYSFEKVYTILDILGLDRKAVDYYKKAELDQYLENLSAQLREGALDDAYNQGHSEGYDEGYDDGYDDGILDAKLNEEEE